MNGVLIGKTKSRCLLCEDIVNAEYVEKENKVFLEKICEKCNKRTSILVENDADFFKRSWWIPLQKSGIKPGSDIERRIYLYLTKRCNLNCKVCTTDYLTEERDMSFDIIKKLIKKHKQKYVSLYGGEPSLREDIFEIIDSVKSMGKIPTINTNGLKLADKSFVKKLKDRGVRVVSFSLDCLDEDCSNKFHGNDKALDLKMKAFRNLEEVGFNITIYSRFIEGITDNYVGGMLDLAQKNSFIKELWFFPAVDVGRYLIKGKNPSMSSDVVKKVQEETNGKLGKEDFIEFRRFEININRLLRKTFLRYIIKDPVLGNNFVLPITRDGFSPIIKSEDLKKVNDKLERENPYKGLTSLLGLITKNPKIIKFLLMAFDRYADIKINSDLILVGVFVVPSPQNFDHENHIKQIEYDGAGNRACFF